MPNCTTCHVAAMTAAHSATAVRELGIVGALSVTALPYLAVRHKLTVHKARAASDPTQVLRWFRVYRLSAGETVSDRVRRADRPSVDGAVAFRRELSRRRPAGLSCGGTVSLTPGAK